MPLDTPVLFTTPNSAFTNLPANEVKTDASGQVTVTNLTGVTVGTQTVEAEIGGQTVRVTITVTPLNKALTFTATGENVNFNSEAAEYQSTIEVSLQYTDGNSPLAALPAETRVVWTVKTVDNPDKPWWLRSDTAKNGLTWGNTADGTSMWTADAVADIVPTSGVARITDVVGSRTVPLTASVCIGGNNNAATEAACNTSGGEWLSGEKTVTFGDGPLSVFTTNPDAGKGLQWATASGAKDANSGLDSTQTTTPYVPGPLGCVHTI